MTLENGTGNGPVRLNLRALKALSRLGLIRRGPLDFVEPPSEDCVI